MKTIDRTPFVDKEGTLSFQNRIQAGLKYGFGWVSELKAQQSLVARLKRALSDRYVLLHNVTLPDLEVPVPIILVGPPGVTVLYVTPLRGVFRARGDQWLEVTSDHQTKRAKPNLVTRTALYAGAIRVFLEKKGFENPAVEGVMVCTNPGMYVESTRPVTRVVLADAIDMFINGFNQVQPVLTYEVTAQMVQAIMAPPPRPAAAEGSSPAAVNNVRRASAKKSGALFTRGQWIVLGVLGGLLTCSLIGFILWIISTLK